MLITLDFPPGVRDVGTDMQSAGRWVNASLVRWANGATKPVGGWSEYGSPVFAIDDPARGCLAALDSNSQPYVLAGTYKNLFAYDATNGIQDITPAGFTEGFQSQDGDQIVTSWSFARFGNIPLGVSNHDGRLYEWSTGDATASLVSNAPTVSRYVMVTEERIVMTFRGSTVTWSGREDRTEWTPSATNEAGSHTFPDNVLLMCGHASQLGGVILTDIDAHRYSYIEQPFIYGFEKIGSGCGVISRMASADTAAGVFWMGKSGFFVFRGGQVEPLACEVWDAVYQFLRRSQQTKIWAINNNQHNEVWWFIPRSSDEPNRYISYNYVENHWSFGNMVRTCGDTGDGYFDNPIWFGPGVAFPDKSTAFEHETGFAHVETDGSHAQPFAESGPVMLGDGEQVMTATKFIPDEYIQGDCEFAFFNRLHPNELATSDAYREAANPTSVRFTGRQTRLAIRGKAQRDWRWGIGRLEVKPRGTR